MCKLSSCFLPHPLKAALARDLAPSEVGEAVLGSQVEAVKSGFACPTQVPLFISAFIIGSASERGLSSAVRMAQISV